MKLRAALVPLLALPLVAQDKPAKPTVEEVKDYWYSGKAEVNRFNLRESRYGQTRKGDAVLVFVTEDFLSEKQVKNESGDARRKGSVSVLKLNALKKFNTGVYDYSMMSSVFTPVESPHRSLKLTASVQEWCGHVYQQLNLRGDSYHVRGHSYLENEGDEDFKLPAPTILENEVWTRIRLAPHKLPTGKIKVIPSVFDARLRHRKLKVQDAEAKLEVTEMPVSSQLTPLKLWQYTLNYPGMGRKLTVVFDKEFPFKIVSWQEDLAGGRVTKAYSTHVERLAYWNMSGNKDEPRRKKLGLPLGR